MLGVSAVCLGASILVKESTDAKQLSADCFPILFCVFRSTSRFHSPLFADGWLANGEERNLSGHHVPQQPRHRISNKE